MYHFDAEAGASPFRKNYRLCSGHVDNGLYVDYESPYAFAM
jgi:hypothetical protein